MEFLKATIEDFFTNMTSSLVIQFAHLYVWINIGGLQYEIPILLIFISWFMLDEE